jgi:epidermal growth factor receptor substrate 15
MTAKVAESDARQALEQTRLEADELQQLIQAKEKEEERFRQALADKEQELASAQQSLASSTVKIGEQERALLEAQSQDFNLDDQASIEHIRPDVEKLPMPSDPQLWFDLVLFLQNASQEYPLPLTLSNLLDELEQSIEKTEALLEQDDLEGIEKISKTLLTLAEKVQSHALIQLMQSIANDCSNGMADNVSIRWPATKQGIQRTLRVVYSHMH